MMKLRGIILAMMIGGMISASAAEIVKANAAWKSIAANGKYVQVHDNGSTFRQCTGNTDHERYIGGCSGCCAGCTLCGKGY